MHESDTFKTTERDNRIILLTTMGHTWGIVPELLGFTNPDLQDLYRDHPEKKAIDQLRDRFQISPVSEIWIITTAGHRSEQAVKDLRKWQKGFETSLCFKFLICEGVDDLGSFDECSRMADLIFRAVLHASRMADQLLISLAGGRKTMSADMQRAAVFFGCRALLHVVDRKNAWTLLKSFDFSTPLSCEQADCIMPLVLQHQVTADHLTMIPNPLNPEHYPLDKQDGRLLDEIDRRHKTASSIFVNYSRSLVKNEPANFRRLYTLSPERITMLKSRRIGVDLENQANELAWLNHLPKPELHCHLGGILSPEEMIRVAGSEKEMTRYYRKSVPAFDRWLKTIESAVRNQDTVLIKKETAGSGKVLRNKFEEIPEPFTVCGFLQAFQGHADLLSTVIFGNFLQPEQFHGVGINRYEPLGDLQGSGLLQTKNTLREACRVLKAQVRQDHITYLELRCSPLNCTRGGLSGREVVGILLDELTSGPEDTPEAGNSRKPGGEHQRRDRDCRFQLIFIASRHGDENRIIKHIELAQQMLDSDRRFSDHFSGFDLAGDESARQPGELREAFLPLMERCVRITIHAGENQPVENIWQAVYHLSADRIGHGLTLGSREELLQRFIDRKIAVEMCPSSNDQIVGFRDRAYRNTGRSYPLKHFLEKGVKVTINTDDPGMSRTGLSREYLKAARMSPGGLSAWEVLQIIRNGYRAAFAGRDIKNERLIQAEDDIMEDIFNRRGLWRKLSGA